MSLLCVNQINRNREKVVQWLQLSHKSRPASSVVPLEDHAITVMEIAYDTDHTVLFITHFSCLFPAGTYFHHLIMSTLVGYLGRTGRGHIVVKEMSVLKYNFPCLGYLSVYVC